MALCRALKMDVPRRQSYLLSNMTFDASSTGNDERIVRVMLEATNPPSLAALLVCEVRSATTKSVRRKHARPAVAAISQKFRCAAQKRKIAAADHTYIRCSAAHYSSVATLAVLHSFG